ncbi:MAG: hypothetical protein WEF50_14315 [Myxococcota bacterium]
MSIVALHALALVVHSQSHQAIPVPLSPLQNAFAVTVIVVAPLVAAALIWRGFPRVGGTALGLAMLGAFLFGFINHYVLDSPDNVAQIPATGWGDAFTWSAHALALLELGGVFAASWLLRASARAQTR